MACGAISTVIIDTKSGIGKPNSYSRSSLLHSFCTDGFGEGMNPSLPPPPT